MSSFDFLIWKLLIDCLFPIIIQTLKLLKSNPLPFHTEQETLLKVILICSNISHEYIKLILLHRLKVQICSFLLPRSLCKLKLFDWHSVFSYALNFRVRSLQLSTVCLTALTYSNELNQSVVDEGSLRQEEAAPWTQVMEEEQVLLLHKEKTGNGKLRKGRHSDKP